jgi:hypothetical protein
VMASVCRRSLIGAPHAAGSLQALAWRIRFLHCLHPPSARHPHDPAQAELEAVVGYLDSYGRGSGLLGRVPQYTCVLFNGSSVQVRVLAG